MCNLSKLLFFESMRGRARSVSFGFFGARLNVHDHIIGAVDFFLGRFELGPVKAVFLFPKKYVLVDIHFIRKSAFTLLAFAKFNSAEPPTLRLPVLVPSDLRRQRASVRSSTDRSRQITRAEQTCGLAGGRYARAQHPSSASCGAGRGAS